MIETWPSISKTRLMANAVVIRDIFATTGSQPFGSTFAFQNVESGVDEKARSSSVAPSDTATANYSSQLVARNSVNAFPI